MLQPHETVMHICRTHHRSREQLLLVCVTDKCFVQGLLCYHCASERHSGIHHNIKTLEQLRGMLTNAQYSQSLPNTVEKHFRFVKEAREKCIVNLNEARSRIQQAFERAEQATSSKFDQLERIIYEKDNLVTPGLPNLMELSTGQSTVELNTKSISAMRALLAHESLGLKVGRIAKQTQLAVKKCKTQMSKDLPRLAPLVFECLTALLEPLNEQNVSSYMQAADQINEKQPQLKSAEEYYARGVQNYNKGQRQKASQDWDRTIFLDPNCFKAYNGRGLLYFNAGQHESALQFYNWAIQLDPFYAISYHNRGKLHFERGEKHKALQDFKRAIELNPNLSQTYNSRANLYKTMGQPDKALKDYGQAIRFDPNNVAAYNGRGNIYSDMGHRDLAFKDYEKALQIDPNYALAKSNQALLLQEMKRKR